jgi:heme A synthase
VRSRRDSAGAALSATALLTAAATYWLVLLGSTVRVSDSGMGCSDWPLCHGQIAPVDQFHALLEQSHRYLAFAATVGVVAVAVLARRSRSSRRVIVPAFGAVAVVIVQVLLGAVTVLTHNAPITVALHLLVGLCLLGVTTATAVAVMLERRGRPLLPDKWGPLAWSSLGITFALFVSGTAVVDSGAAAACPSWPGCPKVRNGWMMAAQLAHRGVAGLAVLALGVLAYRAVRQASSRVPSILGWIMFGLLLAQVAAGATSAVLRAPPAAQDVHLALAATIWVCAVALSAVGAGCALPARSQPHAAGTYGNSSPRPAGRRKQRGAGDRPGGAEGLQTWTPLSSWQGVQEPEVLRLGTLGLPNRLPCAGSPRTADVRRKERCESGRIGLTANELTS